MTQNLEPSRPALVVRTLTPADLAFADSIRALAGWNQTLADWERFLTTEPQGCFLAEWNGNPAGTATTIRYGRDLAWIGMVIVHSDFRQRGIGRALLEHCISHLRGLSVRCIKLDATPAGKLVYDKLGFRSEWTLRRWVGIPATLPSTPPPPPLRTWQTTDATAVESLDVTAFGVSRRSLLAALGRESNVALVLEPKSGSVAGFGFARAGSQALYVGPVVANSSEGGLALVEALIAQNPGKMVYWDIPDPNEAAASLAQRYGLTVQRPLIRMFLGENSAAGEPRRQFGLAGPEVG